jgi:hypothetical protein
LLIYKSIGIGVVDKMKELQITFNSESPVEKGQTIKITAESNENVKLLYKFFVGTDGVWNVLRDFDKENSIEWIPEEEGTYIIMVQAKPEKSRKPFDYMSRVDYVIGKVKGKLIENVVLEKSELKVGEKLKLSVESTKLPVVYKYWVKENDKWELIKEYSTENTLNFSVRTPGEHEILVECKGVDSKNNCDDSVKVKFKVIPIENVVITDFTCLSSELLVENELVFQVNTDSEDNRMVLYKFIKINAEGSAVCVQDYSTKRIVSFIENTTGSFKLLCLVKDMYSPKEYDDRALINYTVKLYNPIEIHSFTSDLSSPQVADTSIQLKALIKGGKKLLYRYIIEGANSVDSGYIKQNTYIWKPKNAGKYEVRLWVKDSTFEGEYEAEAYIKFIIDDEIQKPVKICEVLMDRHRDYIKNDTINVKVIAEGGLDLRYSFVVLKSGKEVEKVAYGTCSWVNFTPEDAGVYELDIRVKDKYSTKDYDVHHPVHFEVRDYIPAQIDYVLMPSKEMYLVGDNIHFDIVARKTKETLVKYVLRINGYKVEETEYVEAKKYSFTPKYSGEYTVELLARNKESDKEFDCKREVKICVQDAVPVNNTKIQCDKTDIRVNEAITFSAKCDGGKDVCYEFYIMEHDEWNLIQNYSKKDYYTFMPFVKGRYKILALCKSGYKSCAYEDYDIMEFTVADK